MTARPFRILGIQQVAVGGNDAVSVGSVATAMLGVHALIGIGEGIITMLAVGAVLGLHCATHTSTPSSRRTHIR